MNDNCYNYVSFCYGLINMLIYFKVGTLKHAVQML